MRENYADLQSSMQGTVSCELYWFFLFIYFLNFSEYSRLSWLASASVCMLSILCRITDTLAREQMTTTALDVTDESRLKLDELLIEGMVIGAGVEEMKSLIRLLLTLNQRRLVRCVFFCSCWSIRQRFYFFARTLKLQRMPTVTNEIVVTFVMFVLVYNPGFIFGGISLQCFIVGCTNVSAEIGTRLRDVPPHVGLGNPPLSRHFPTSLPSSLSFSIFFFFSLSYSCFICLLAFHPFPFYQNSPTSFPRPDVVGGD